MWGNSLKLYINFTSCDWFYYRQGQQVWFFLGLVTVMQVMLEKQAKTIHFSTGWKHWALIFFYKGYKDVCCIPAGRKHKE